MKKFDCVQMKRRGAEQVREKTVTMSREQELKFWQEHSRNLCQCQAEIQNKNNIIEGDSYH